MSCELTGKVSALVDEELDEREAESLREHIGACEVCRQAQREFLLLRSAIKSYTSGEPSDARERLLKQILVSDYVPFWKRRVALPVPALALLLLAVLFTGGWWLTSRFFKRAAPPAGIVREEKKEAATPPAPQTGDEIDLARFDHGGRAVIYKVRREDSTGASQ